MVIKVELNKRLELAFRKKAMKEFGYSRGSIQRAMRDALQQWVQKKGKPSPKADVSLIVGLVKNVKKTGVELQHEAAGL